MSQQNAKAQSDSGTPQARKEALLSKFAAAQANLYEAEKLIEREIEGTSYGRIIRPLMQCRVGVAGYIRRLATMEMKLARTMDQVAQNPSGLPPIRRKRGAGLRTRGRDRAW